MLKQSSLLLLAICLLGISPDAAAQTQTRQVSDDSLINTTTNQSNWLGVIVGEKDDHVWAAMRIAAIDSLAVQRGDVIASINETAVSTVDQLKSTYASIEVGSEVTVHVERNGEPVSFSFAKPDPSTTPRIRIEDMN